MERFDRMVSLKTMKNMRECRPSDFVYVLKDVLDNKTIEHIIKYKLDIYNKWDILSFLLYLDGNLNEKIINAFSEANFIDGVIGVPFYGEYLTACSEMNINTRLVDYNIHNLSFNDITIEKAKKIIGERFTITEIPTKFTL